MSRNLASGLLAGGLLAVAISAQAHGNIHIPWWFWWLAGIYVVLPFLLLPCAIAAVFDRNVARWQRVAPLTSLVGGGLLFYAINRGAMWALFGPLADGPATALALMLALLVPTVVTGIWLAGRIARWRRSHPTRFS